MSIEHLPARRGAKASTSRPPPRLLTRKEAAEALRRSKVTLARWARNGTGPKIIRINGRPLYPEDGLYEFLGLEA